MNKFQARERGRQYKGVKMPMVCTAKQRPPISWARNLIAPGPGAYAPGFMLPPAPQAKSGILVQSPFGP